MKIKIGNKTFEVSKEELEKNPDEIQLDFDGTIRTQEEDTSFIENHKNDARTEGIEIAVKKYRDKYDFQGRSLENLLEAVEKKTIEDAKIEPNEKIKTLQSKLSDKEEALKNALETVKSKDQEFVSFRNQTKLNNELSSLIPENTLLPKDDVQLILKNKLKLDFDENGNVIALDDQGNVMKDKTTANNLSLKQVTETFFKENQHYLKPVQGGSGGGDTGGNGGKLSLEEFMDKQREQGIVLNSDEFNKNLQDAIESKTVEA